MHDNFKRILWICGHFGVIIREHAEALVYTGAYGRISANNTFAKLEREYGYLKRLDRGKRKSDAYRLTQAGVGEFRRLFGYEPKVFVSLDKIMHSVQVVNFYTELFRDSKSRQILDQISINEDKNIINFNVQRGLSFVHKNKDVEVIPDGFCIYKYEPKRAVAFFLEIENSNRKSSAIATKTITNYEGYYLSNKWRSEPWQPQNTKIFPMILMVVYSEWKMRELIRHFKAKKSINLKYYFTYYKLIEDKGFSSDIWYNIEGEKHKILP